MKTGISIRTVSLAATLTALSLGAVTAQAGDRNAQYLQACRAELQQYYGEERELMVVSKRRIAEGTRVTLSAREDRDNTEFVNCWIPNDDARGNQFRQGSDTVAATITPVPVIQ